MPVRSYYTTLAPFVIFGVHHLLQALDLVQWPTVHAYLDPLCFLPILLTAWLLERNWLFGVKRLPDSFTIIATLVLALIGEEIFPRIREGFTHDWWDYPFYFLGALYFWWCINPKQQH